jgi:thiol:disulfide interchange protein DsbD
MPVRLRFFSLCLLLFAAPLLSAQVKVSLVATETSVAPGRPITVALRLDHEREWHTYWINPGTGYPTSLTWELPPGWTAGNIQWPTPHVVKDRKGNITGNGYENVTYLPVVLTPPADARPGDIVTVRALADWLMCADVCIPGEARVALDLRIAAEPPQRATGPGAEAAETVRTLPQDVPGWEIAATRSGQTVTLSLKAGADAPRKDPTELWFFASDGFIQYDQPQTVRRGPGGEYLLDLPVAQAADQATARLTGVLASKSGWLADGSVTGLRIDVPLAAAAPGAAAATTGPAAAAPAGGLAGTLALAALGGLILNLMPCVFPVLGIKILGFVNQAGSDRRRVVMHGLVFTLGVLVSFWALAGALAVLRAGGDQLGWGFQLQSPGFVYALALILLVFALNMSGVFEFGLGATGVGAGLQTKSGYTGSFFTGVLATVVATPCSAPFLAPALGAALALPVAESFAIFTAIALGLSAPYLLLSVFPQAIRVLPRPGAWMETFKQFMAFPLYATVAALVWVLAGQVSEGGMLTALLGLVVVALGAWIYGRWNAPGASAGRARFGLVAGALAMALGIWAGWPRAAAPDDIVWEPWSAETVARLRAEGRPIYVDFTARWCATCQTNKKLVFASDDVRAYFAKNKVATLKADWTNQDPAITAELAKWNRSAVPFNLVYLPGQPEPAVLPELLTPSIVLDAMKG